VNTKPLIVGALPDETLDSLIARTYKLSGYSSWSCVRADVVGEKGHFPGNGIPSRLDHVARFFGGASFGAELLRRFTLWNGLTAFIPAENRDCLIRRLLKHSNNGSRSPSSTQIRPRTKQPFRFCSVCMSDELKTYGVSYWHRSHQMPLVSTLHFVPTSRGFHVIRLPHETIECTPILNNSPNADAKHFASLSHDILDFSEPADVATLPWVYRKRMRSNGLAVGARIHYKQLADLCSTVQASLVDYAHLGSANHWLSHVLYGHSTNAAMNLILIVTLFEDWTDFIEAWSHYEPERPVQPASPGRRPLPSHGELHRSFIVPGATVQTVAKSLGWSANTIRNRAKYFGIAVPSRKGLISVRVKKAIASELSNGVPGQRISRCKRISLSTIYEIRRSSAVITKVRAEAIAEAERRRRRNNLQRYLDADPSLRRSDVRSMDKCLYGWLLKHDKAWFESTIHRRTSPAARKNS
jgi:hypothetical protein